MKNVATILLYDDKKRFLLQHRTNNAPVFPNEYGFFGGTIEKNETPETAVIRECKEELEYELTNPKLAFHSIKDSQYGKRDIYVFLEEFNPNIKLILHEGQGMKWVALEEINDLPIVNYLLDILLDMYNKI